jgi:hypothetical protein
MQKQVETCTRQTLQQFNLKNVIWYFQQFKLPFNSNKMQDIINKTVFIIFWTKISE